MKIKCPKCKYKDTLVPSQKFCPNCGHELSYDKIIKADKEKKNKQKVKVLIFIFLLTVIAFFVSLFSVQSEKSSINKEQSTRTVSEKSNSYSKDLKMPKFEVVDNKMGSMLVSVAAYYEDRSKENIILAAKCWHNQKGKKNVFVYFVNDPTYKIDNRREETEKVIAFYDGSSNRSILYFLNPDGTERESIDIKSYL